MGRNYESCEFNDNDINKMKKVCDKATQVNAYYPHYHEEGNIRGPFCRWFDIHKNEFVKKHEGKEVGWEKDDIDYACLALSAFPNALDKITQLQKSLEIAVGALKFYKSGEHFSGDEWENPSGEPINILCWNEEPFYIESGEVARQALKQIQERE